MSSHKLLSSINLASMEGGKILLSRMEEPYGPNSKPVVSIGIALGGDEPDWKVHIPLENIDELIEALKSAKQS